MPKFTQGELLVKICYTFGGVGLFALSLTASALSLGQSQGQVVLGAPLDLVFQWQPDADMDAASSCVRADVLLGERRIDASRVNITPLARRAGLPASVRVRASVVIDEPVVVVKLLAGCQGQTSRSYTFFAELPETVAASGAALDIRQLSELSPPPAIAPPAERARASAPARRAEPASRPTASANPPQAPAEPRPRKPAPKPSKAPAAPAPTVAAAGESGLRMEPRLRIDSRLRMEPVENWTAPAAGAAALTVPGAPAAPAAEGVAAVPDVTLPAVAPEADQRVLALETQIQSMKAREASQNASLARISTQLEALQAEKEQGSPWTLPLLAALAIALALLAWLLLRLRNLTQAAANSWRDSGDGYVAAMPDAAAGDTAFGSAVPFVAPAASAATPPVAAVDVRQDEITTEFGLSAFGASASADAAALAQQKPRAVVKPEELFDVRQQAEFFTSVGEYEQAIAVMRKHIAEHEDSSPLAYLELLGLFYQLSRKTEYEELRRQFEQHFAARVPEMAQFAQRGRSLAHYPDLLANIEALWPTEEVGDLLESYLFRQPGQDLLFDLEAFDDLLLLQAVARTTPARARGETAGRVRTTPAVAPDDTPPASVTATALAAAAAVPAAGAVAAPVEQPWATLDRSHASAPPLVPLPEALETPELSLEIPSRFDVPEGPFARAEPLSPDAAGADAPAASSLLDIDLSDVGRWQPLDLPAVEPLPFDLEEFPKRPIVGSPVDQSVGFNAMDPKQSLPADLELTPWEEESSPDSIFSAWNAARTDRVIAKPVVDEDKKDKPEAGNGPG